jgi:polyhydroxyalkanoate synthesis regulator phasin
LFSGSSKNNGSTNIPLPPLSSVFPIEIGPVSDTFVTGLIKLKLKEVTMFELLEKAVLTGLGALSLTQKKAEEILAELKEKYKLSEEEGKAFLDKVQGMAKEGRERIAEIADAEVKKVIERVGLVPREEFDRLQKRLEELEKRLPGDDPGAPC